MRDCNVITTQLEDKSPDNTVKCIYKEVVIVGNGPSAITLSFLLSGHRPYYNRLPHPDPMLSARLIECTQKSLLHQDLPFLSQGLEGRSKNPISLLIDAMIHPGADMGLEWPSLLSWKKTTKNLDHVVIGKEDPGGTWHGIADHILTISPGRWMALPGLEFKEYNDKRAPASAVANYYMDYVKKNDLLPYMVSHSTVTTIQPILCKTKRRVRWKVWVTDANNSTISYECRHLVLATGASDRAGCLGVPGELFPFVFHDLKNFEENLTRIREETLLSHKFHLGLLWKSGNTETHSLPHSQSNGHVNFARTSDSLPNHISESEKNFREVRDKKFEMTNGIVRIIQVQHLNDIKRDGYSNECTKVRRLKNSDNLFKEKHDVWYTSEVAEDDELQPSLNNLNLSEGSGLRSEKDENVDESDCNQVLVVGAGLSAADAILVAWRKNYSVVHAFRSPLSTAHLPATMYPEYHELYKLMEGSFSRKDYHPLPGHQITEIHKDNFVQLSDASGNKKTLKVLSVAVLIGSQPDLFFLPNSLKNLGIDPNKPVDCKVNPVQIDPFSYKCVRAPPGLYALGPLVGDNFVRFLQGGAIAIAGHIFKDNNLSKSL